MNKVVKGLGLLALAGGIAYVGLGSSSASAKPAPTPEPKPKPKPGPDVPPGVGTLVPCPGPDVRIDALPEPCRSRVLSTITSALRIGADGTELGPAIEDDMLKALAADLRAQGKKTAADQVDGLPRNVAAGGGMPAGYCPGPDAEIADLREPCRTYVRQTLAAAQTLEADPDAYARAQGAGIRLRLAADLEREGKTQAAEEVRT